MTEDAQQPFRQRLVDGLRVHPRNAEQGRSGDSDAVASILDAIPSLVPFGSNTYESLDAVLDWDHRIPSKYATLRVFASYSSHEHRRLSTQLRAREQTIATDDLFPEFDVPDFDDVQSSENYTFIFDVEHLELLDQRFDSGWRKEVSSDDLAVAVRALSAHQPFKRAQARRASETFGGPILVGWAPPFLAESERWCLEFWLVTSFDGHAGTALVCMVDLVEELVTRHHVTEVATR